MENKITINHEKGNDANRLLCADFLISKGFSKAERWFDNRWKQFRVYFKIDGYDCDILIFSLSTSCWRYDTRTAS